MAGQTQLLALAPLLAEQQGVHPGQPGGLGHALDVPIRAEMLRFPEKNRPRDLRDPCDIAPDHPDAHDVMAVFITRLMDRIIASKYFFKEYEHAALDWLQDQFKGRAAVQFRLVLGEAKRVATTSGIGQNSVLYRVLRDMLLAYPAHGVKASITKKKTELLVWAPNKTVAEIHTSWMAYYEAYDRAVDLTRNLADVTLIVPEQDWPTRFTEMQAIFPSWVTTLIINYPARFVSMAASWLAINAEANRQAAGRKSGVNGRIFQLGAPMVAGDMESYTEELFDEALAGAGPFLCAMGRGVSGCWRCGDKEHLRRDCPQAPSEAEQNGRPMNAWAKMGPRTAAPVRTTGTTSSFPPRGTMGPTQVAQMAMMTERLDRQDAMFEAVLERFSTLVPQGYGGGEAMSASGVGLGIDTSAAAPVMQMAVPLHVQAPLVIGGVQPEGYIFVGMNRGMSVWGHADVVAASVTELNGEPGNV
jgi:hypothetical protein